MMTPDLSIKNNRKSPEHLIVTLLAATLLTICFFSAGGCAGATAANASGPLQRYDYTRLSMGVEAKIVFYTDSKEKAQTAANACFKRLDDLEQVMSDYRPDSELMKLCDASTAHPGTPIPVSNDLWNVVSQAQKISEASDGAFDITVGPIVQLWRNARKTHQMPDPEALAKARALVGYKMVHLLADKDRTISMDKPGMRLDLGGIGKGFADQQLADLLKSKFHITSCLIDLGGDLVIGDAPPDQPKGWPVAIRSQSENSDDEIVHLHNTGIATSGDLEQFVEFNGIRYSHIVDPKTGLGLTTRTAVTAIAPNGADADALASAISVLGPKKGIAMLMIHFPSAGYSTRLVAIAEDDDGKVKTPEQTVIYESPTFPHDDTP